MLFLQSFRGLSYLLQVNDYLFMLSQHHHLRACSFIPSFYPYSLLIYLDFFWYLSFRDLEPEFNFLVSKLYLKIYLFIPMSVVCVHSMHLLKIERLERVQVACSELGERERMIPTGSAIHDRYGRLLQVTEGLNSCLNIEHLAHWQIQLCNV